VSVLTCCLWRLCCVCCRVAVSVAFSRVLSVVLIVLSSCE